MNIFGGAFPSLLENPFFYIKFQQKWLFESGTIIFYDCTAPSTMGPQLGGPVDEIQIISVAFIFLARFPLRALFFYQGLVGLISK